jgi:hypothetical protein
MRNLQSWPQRMAILVMMVLVMLCSAGPAVAQQRKPNILVIFADDVGVWNISAYHRGMMGGRTPNLDRLAHDDAVANPHRADPWPHFGHDATGFVPADG